MERKDHLSLSLLAKLWPFLPQRCIAGLQSVCYPQGPGDLSQQSCFPASQLPGCTSALGCSSGSKILHSPLLNFMRILCRVLKPVEVPLNSSTSSGVTSLSSQFYMICKLAEDALHPITPVINEDSLIVLAPVLSPRVHHY